MSRCKPDSCLGCPLYDHGTDFSQVEGHGSLGVMIVAEASGEQEAHDQLPLRQYAPSGMIFERTLRRLGYSRDQFAVTNIVRCHPKMNLLDGMPYELAAIQHCQSNLLAALRQHKPKVIVAFGNLAFRSLTGVSGDKRTVTHMRGYVFRALPEFCEAAGDPDLKVVPTFHPAFLRRGKISLTGVLARDIQRAVNIRAGKDTSYILDMPLDDGGNARASYESWQFEHQLRYITQPTLRELDLFCRDVKARSDAWLALSPDARAASYLALSHDIETQESASLDEDTTDGFQDTRMVLSQFSIEPGQAIAMPWESDFIKATHWLLQLPLPKVGHNYWLFDQKVQRTVGRRDFNDAGYLVPAGDVYDTLQMFHYWQPDLPAHLQFAASFTQFPFPWKHLNGTNLPFYGCVDVDATQRVYRVVRRTMEDRKIWADSIATRAASGYVNQVHHVRPALASMEDTGLPINDARRLELGAVFDQTRAECLAELDARFPNEARKLHPKTGYKGVPPQVKPLLAEGKLPSEIATIVFQDPPKQQEDGTVDEGDTYRYEQREFAELQLDEQSRILADTTKRWCRVYQFSPNSGPQLMAYMRHHKHKVPYNKKESRETTGKKELERLATKYRDNFYTKVIECREVGKMKATYIDGFRPHADGRAHTTFTFATATGQLSSRNPNCFSADTEVLTDQGWVTFPELHKAALVAEWEIQDGKPVVRFSKPLAYIKNEHDGKLVHIHTKQHIDMLVTADHDCALQKRTGEIVKVKADRYPEDRTQIQAGFWQGGSIKFRESQLILIAALQADGSVVSPSMMPNGNIRSLRGDYDFGLSKERKAARLAKALDAEGIIYRRSLRKSGQHRFIIHRCDIPAWWQNKKEYGSWILQLDHDSFNFLAEEIWFWDGCYDRRSMYSSSIKRNTDWAQILTILSGRRAKIRRYAGVGTRNDNWQVDATDTRGSNTSNRNLTTVSYTGHVYCVTMPWGTIVVRRKGKVSFTFQCQNYPAHGKLGKAIKSMIEAPDGYELANWDFKSYHVLMLGFLAEDPAYMRMARLDMHSYVAWHFLRLPGADKLYELPDADLMEKFAWLKSNEKYKVVRDKQAKPSILGIGLGLMPPHLYEMNREHFASLKQAKEFRSVIQSLFPKVFRWQNAICDQAHRQQVLYSHFGMLRWFYEVQSPDGKGGWRPGDQYNAAMAFPVQNNAHGDLRERMKQLFRSGMSAKYGQCNTIHDSLTFCYPVGMREQHVQEIRPILTSPSRVLVHPTLAPQGLTFGIECSAGKNMASLESVPV